MCEGFRPDDLLFEVWGFLRALEMLRAQSLLDRGLNLSDLRLKVRRLRV